MGSKYESEDKLGYDSRSEKYRHSKRETTAATETSVPGQDDVRGPGGSGKGGYSNK